MPRFRQAATSGSRGRTAKPAQSASINGIKAPPPPAPSPRCKAVGSRPPGSRQASRRRGRPSPSQQPRRPRRLRQRLAAIPPIPAPPAPRRLRVASTNLPRPRNQPHRLQQIGELPALRRAEQHRMLLRRIRQHPVAHPLAQALLNQQAVRQQLRPVPVPWTLRRASPSSCAPPEPNRPASAIHGPACRPGDAGATPRPPRSRRACRCKPPRPAARRGAIAAGKRKPQSRALPPREEAMTSSQQDQHHRGGNGQQSRRRQDGRHRPIAADERAFCHTPGELPFPSPAHAPAMTARQGASDEAPGGKTQTCSRQTR